MSDEEVIKRRLIFDGDGTGEDRRLNLVIKLISKWVNTTDETEEDCLSTYDKICMQLSLIEHAKHRSELLHTQTVNQLKKYNDLHCDMEKKISAIKNQISDQKNCLEEAKIVKQNRIQYNLIARAIEKEPARTEMNRKLLALKQELANLAQEKDQLDHQIDLRKKQFSVLSTSANILADVLKSDAQDDDGAFESNGTKKPDGTM